MLIGGDEEKVPAPVVPVPFTCTEKKIGCSAALECGSVAAECSPTTTTSTAATTNFVWVSDTPTCDITTCHHIAHNKSASHFALNTDHSRCFVGNDCGTLSGIDPTCSFPTPTPTATPTATTAAASTAAGSTAASTGAAAAAAATAATASDPPPVLLEIHQLDPIACTPTPSPKFIECSGSAMVYAKQSVSNYAFCFGGCDVSGAVKGFCTESKFEYKNSQYEVKMSVAAGTVAIYVNGKLEGKGSTGISLTPTATAAVTFLAGSHINPKLNVFAGKVSKAKMCEVATAGSTAMGGVDSFWFQRGFQKEGWLQANSKNLMKPCTGPKILSKPAKPAARYGHVVVMNTQKRTLLMYGGTDGSAIFDDMWEFSISSATWKLLKVKGTPPSARSFFAAVISDKAFTLINGNTIPGPAADKSCCSLPITSLSEFTISTSTWVSVPVTGWIPRPRSGASLSMVNHDLWLFGGATRDFPFIFNDLWVYQLGTKMWSRIQIESAVPGEAPLMPSPRQLHVWVTDGFKGIGESNRFSHVYGGMDAARGVLGDFWRFDHQSQMWYEISANGLTPGKRACAAGIAISGIPYTKVLLYGGLQGEKILDDLWSFDFMTNEWSIETASGTTPKKRGKFSIVPFFNTFYMFGGMGGGAVLEDVWMFDATKMEWTELRAEYSFGGKPMRQSHAAVVIDGVEFAIFGGDNGVGVVDNLMVFNSRKKEWNMVSLPSSVIRPSPRYDIGFVSDCGVTYLYGGDTSTTSSNELWVMRFAWV